MKKQPIRRFAVLLFVGVAVCCGIHFAMPVPDTAEVEIYDSFVSGKYDEIKMRMEEIQRSYEEKGWERVCYETGYVQEKPALFRDRTEIYIPYMAYQMRDVGTAGTQIWTYQYLFAGERDTECGKPYSDRGKRV